MGLEDHQRGSSPHTWRSLEKFKSMLKSNRIISTYVEITEQITTAGPSIEDHLHIRGDHADDYQPCTLLYGSSPHTWRSPLRCFLVNRNLVGSSPHTWRSLFKSFSFLSCFQDHLHIRRDHYGRHWSEFIKLGSSPHTWRSQLMMLINKERGRIISTYVEITYF